MINVKKVMTLGLAVFMLVAGAGCAINTHAPSPTPTAAPTATSTPAEEKGLEDFTQMYAYLKSDISDDSYAMLEEIYDTYGIEVRFDMDEFGWGDLVSKTVNLPVDQYDEAIKETYDFLKKMVEFGIPEDAISHSVDQIHNVTDVDYENSAGLNRKATKDMMVTYFRRDVENRFDTYVSEFSSLLMAKSDLSKFESCNPFAMYDKQAKKEGKDTIRDAEGYSQLDNIADKEKYIWSRGILTSNGSYEIWDDMNDYFRGLFCDYANFWKKYDDYEVVRNKTDALIEELQEINPDFTLDYFRALSDTE